MKVSITSIELKGPFKFFGLSANALSIIRQLKKSDCVAYRKRGFWNKHYTMSMWNSEEEMRAFATSGAHLKAMKDSALLAREIRVITIDSEEFPNWKKAKELLQQGKVLRY